jgi:hypothetical protein
MAFLYQASRPVAQGQMTQTIYSLVRGQRFNEAIQLLEQELQVSNSDATAAADAVLRRPALMVFYVCL